MKRGNIIEDEDGARYMVTGNCRRTGGIQAVDTDGRKHLLAYRAVEFVSERDEQMEFYSGPKGVCRFDG